MTPNAPKTIATTAKTVINGPLFTTKMRIAATSAINEGILNDVFEFAIILMIHRIRFFALFFARIFFSEYPHPSENSPPSH